VEKSPLVNDLDDDALVEFCKKANIAYRKGNPIISDADYDFIYLAELQKRQPNHPFLQSVEPEGLISKKITLPQVMLSTDKAYSLEEIILWTERLTKAASEINFNQTIEIKITPKLDGFAGFDDGNFFYTRGDGRKGQDISRLFTRGLSVFKDSGRGQGPGEIVVKKSYFTQHLANDFEHPRNFQASLIKEKELEVKTQKSIDEKAALFVPFKQLPNWLGTIESLLADFTNIIDSMLNVVDFDVDGVVLETTDDVLKTYLGASRKFHKWQIAFKKNKEKAQVKVLSITPQVGRTGKITPVAELEPTQLSGATIMRATAHNYGFVKNQKLGIDSVIELTRSGEVIPKIIKVLKPAEKVVMPEKCPSCETDLIWQNDFLLCVNDKCPQQNIQTLTYFFKSLANNDGFGIATIEKLYESGIRKISEIYTLKEANFIKIGFGEKTSANLVKQLIRSRTESIEDWRFLGAFGIERLGFGLCERLLKIHKLKDCFTLTVEDINDIDGFAEISAQLIVKGLSNIKDEFDTLFNLGFALEYFERLIVKHTLLDKQIVFTGTMDLSRVAMTKQAKSLGINVGKSVSSKTDFLVIGERVGEKKIKTAQEKGVQILALSDYLKILEDEAIS
jgi:DNA ligase (NAD+)